MSHLDPSDLAFRPEDFSGVARLFPLPNLVLFPHVMQPLHVFEPRYRQLLEDVMSGDRLITLVLLSPDGATDVHGREKICGHACLGKVVTYQRLPAGKYNLLLMGVRRLRIERERPSQRMYRMAEATVVDDVYSDIHEDDRLDLRRGLLKAFRRLLCKDARRPGEHPVEQLLGKRLPLNMLTDVIAYSLDMDLTAKQELLATADVVARARRLLELLRRKGQSAAPAIRGYPPPFSAN